jgi:hypothetical protein
MSDNWFLTAFEAENIQALATQCGFDLTYSEARAIFEASQTLEQFLHIWNHETWWKE